MFFDINKNLCDTFPALDPIQLLDYPAEDVFDLIAGTIDYNNRQNSGSRGQGGANAGLIRRPAGDDWF